MSTFDISAYLNSKGKPAYDISGENPVSKAAAILEASRQKEFELQEQSYAKQEALRKQNEGSLTTMLGLDYNSAVGAPVNLVAGGLNRARQMFTETVAAPFSLGAQAQEELIDPKSMEILKRKSAGAQITPEEEQWINTPTADMYDPLTLSGPTPKQLFEGRFGFEGNRRIANEFRKATDTSSLVNTEAVSKLQDELINKPENAAALKRLNDTNLAYWKAEDLGTLIKGAFEAGGNNPLAVAQLISENLPSVALSMVNPAALVATNIGYAQANYDKWSENFAKREGREPTTEEKKAAQEQANSLAAAETAGDLLTAGATKGLKASLGIGSKAVGTTTPEALKRALGVVGDTLPGKLAVAAAPVISAAAKATSKVLGASAGEAITEGYQTNVENLLEKGENASAEDIYFGATAGALTSGGMASAGAGIGLTKDLFGAAKDVKEVIDERKTTKTETYKAAVESGDITSLINNPNPLQNKWVDAAEALTKNVEGKSEEDIKKTINKIDKDIVSKLETLSQNLLINTEEKASVIEPRIKQLEELLATNPDSQNAKDMLAQYQAKLAAPVDPQRQKDAYQAIAKFQKQLAEVVGLREGLSAQLTEGEAGVLEAARAITESSTTEGTTAPVQDVPKLIARAMKVRGTKTQALADALSAVADLDFTSPEDAKTLRILSAEIVASNKAKNSQAVSKDVYYGKGSKAGTTPRPGLDFKGVFTYQEEFDKSFAKNDKEKATKEFDGLSNFLKSHTDKLSTFKQIKPGTMALVDTQGNWVVKDIPAQSTASSAVNYARKNGGFAWFGNNPTNKGLVNTIAAIEEEISVMTPVLQKMALQLGKPITTPALKTEGQKSVKQTTEAKQTKEKESKVFKPTIVDKGTQQASTGEGKATQVKPTEEVKPKELEVVKPVENDIVEAEIADPTYSEEITKAINETEDQLSQDKTESVVEATTESQSQENIDDTARVGSSINEDSDKFDEQEQAIKEEPKYTSKQDALKEIKLKKQAFVDFINCL